MNMSFQEKSAWGSLVGLGLVGNWYFPKAFLVAQSSNSPAPLFWISVGCIIALIIIFSVYHAAIAIHGGDETDERDQLIDLKSERIASYVLGIGLFWLVARIVSGESMFGPEPMNSLMIAVWILFGITASEVVKNIAQIIYYRVDA